MVTVLSLDGDVFHSKRMRDSHLFPGGRSCRHRIRDKSLFSKSGIPLDAMAVLLCFLVLLGSWGTLSNAADDHIDSIVAATQKAIFDKITSSIKKDITKDHTIVARSATGDKAPPSEVPSETAANSTAAASNTSEGAKPEITARSADSATGNDTASQNGTEITARSADFGNSTSGDSNVTTANTTAAEITPMSAGGEANSTSESAKPSGDKGNSTEPAEVTPRSAGGATTTTLAPGGDAAAGNGTASGNSTTSEGVSPPAAPAVPTPVA